MNILHFLRIYFNLLNDSVALNRVYTNRHIVRALIGTTVFQRVPSDTGATTARTFAIKRAPIATTIQGVVTL